jgi:predicted  nucleic acid-binding Zn-ribbon protein
VGTRETVLPSVPASLLAEYEPLRHRLGGVAIAKLEGGSCKGCHLKLSNFELDRIRALPTDEVVHCEECGRILVR